MFRELTHNVLDQKSKSARTSLNLLVYFLNQLFHHSFGATVCAQTKNISTVENADVFLHSKSKYNHELNLQSFVCRGVDMASISL